MQEVRWLLNGRYRPSEPRGFDSFVHLSVCVASRQSLSSYLPGIELRSQISWVLFAVCLFCVRAQSQSYRMLNSGRRLLCARHCARGWLPSTSGIPPSAFIKRRQLWLRNMVLSEVTHLVELGCQSRPVSPEPHFSHCTLLPLCDWGPVLIPK